MPKTETLCSGCKSTCPPYTAHFSF